MSTRPRDERTALVLTGGGARAAYQIGVLAGIAECAGGDVPLPIVTGVSAGAINAASVAARGGSLQRVVDRMAAAWLRLSVDQVFDASHVALGMTGAKWAWSLLTGGGLPKLDLSGILDTAPLRRTLEHFFKLEGIDTNLRRGRLRALGITTTCYSTGRTVTFVQGQTEIETWRRSGRLALDRRIDVDTILASTALPLIFPAVAVDGLWYGDGSLRQTAPLAPAVHLGARRILAIAVRHARTEGAAVGGDPPQPAQVLGALFNAVFLDALDADAERLERVNRSLRQLGPGRVHPDGLRPVELVIVRPSRNLSALATDLRRHMPPALRTVLRGMGSAQQRNADLLSYLLFEGPYVERLLELGRADAKAQWDRIARLLDDADREAGLAG